MTYPNVADISSAQVHPDGSGFDARAYKDAGRDAIIIKSTEATGYHFSIGDQWTRDALNVGLVVGRYHWAGSSQGGILRDPVVEGDFFLSFNGAHRPGLFAACDFENPLRGKPLYGLSPAAAAEWTDAFLAHIADKEGWPGMGYSMSGSGVVQRLRAPYPKWYAGYPGPVPADRAMHQFTDNGVVPGVGRCDDSYCYIDLRSFAGTGGSQVRKVSDDYQEEIVLIEPAAARKAMGLPEDVTVGVPPANSGGAKWRDVWGSLSVDTRGDPSNDLRVVIHQAGHGPSDGWYAPAGADGDIVHCQSGRGKAPGQAWQFGDADECVNFTNLGRHTVDFMVETAPRVS